MDRINVSLMELKLDANSNDAMSFEGYGAVFNNIDSYGDVILPGAFKATLREAKKANQWPAMLLQHGGFKLTAQDMMPVGVWTDLDEDDTGLRVKGKLAPTPRGQEVYELMKMSPRPAITGLSIGYMAKEFILGTKPDEPRRQLKKIDLFEISPVTFPANGSARVSAVKSLDEIVSLADAEDFLREVGGLSKSQAVAFIARVKAAAAGRGDHDPDTLSELTTALRSHTERLRAN